MKKILPILIISLLVMNKANIVINRTITQRNLNNIKVASRGVSV